MNTTHNFSICPRCGAPTEKSITWSGAPSEFWYSCTYCNTHINTYQPQEHQFKFHQDAHRTKGNFGAYGTGKTLTSRQEFYKHLFLTPNGVTLIGANISHQYEQTIKRDIEQDLPKSFIRAYNAQKSYYDFNNGHRLLFRPLDDQGKLRSLNLTMFIILEASEVDSEIYHQLKTRLRNSAAQITSEEIDPDTKLPKVLFDWRSGIIESNPDSGWIRTDVLLRSSLIVKHPLVTEKFRVHISQADPNISAHVTPTKANRYLPKTYYEEQSVGKPSWWIRRYLDGSFSYAEGLVYPSAMSHIVTTFAPDRRWKRLIAFDYGLSDAACLLFGAVDDKEGILYIYKELRAYDRSVEQLAALYFQGANDIPAGGLWGSPLIDPKSGPKRDYNKKTLADHFMEYGIYFKPGAVSVDARVYRMNTYFEKGRLKIMDCCTYLIDELRDYKFPDKKVGAIVSDKPVDKNNHSINAVEWICMELPKDPAQLQLGSADLNGNPLLTESKLGAVDVNSLPWNLADGPDLSKNEDVYGLGYDSYLF